MPYVYKTAAEWSLSLCDMTQRDVYSFSSEQTDTHFTQHNLTSAREHS